MRMQEIMSRDIETIGPKATGNQARAAMQAAGVRHLLVVEGGRPRGIISSRDVGGAVASYGNTLTVADLMTETLVTARPDTTVRQAANLLRGHVIGCLVVLDGERPVGIVTTTDLLDLLGRGAEKPAARSEKWTLRSRGVRRAGPSDRHARRG